MLILVPLLELRLWDVADPPQLDSSGLRSPCDSQHGEVVSPQ